ncbi:TRAP transporter substrate-binding protein [Candidatus Albibeggiatoa sp. nov. NOAA]|uniref:TRAP transporter substrate-binding protein n=1 Tax=Candidatus Albibeggiatoa sp. nov. NOAA TaxID=3162724 RepID=UPI003302941C|nr:TRAP transporter substrate-binding protein [Thiotrichaceae bacterium]
MKLIKLLALVWVTSVLVSCGGDDTNKASVSTITWDMPTPYSDAVFHTKNIHAFAAEVKQLTDGHLNIQVHSGASLYKHPEIKRAIRSGQVPIGEVLISLLGNEDPLFQVDSLPLLATSYDRARKLWQVSRPEIEALLDKQGLKLLYAVPWPPQGLYTKKPINVVEDMEGAKIRVYNALLSRLVELLGGNPSTVQSPEIPQAFSTGLINAMITSPSTGVSSQCWDFVSHYYDIQAWIPKNMVFVNKRAFDRLTPDMQNALLAAARHAEERGWEMSEKETAEKTRTLSSNGMFVLKPTLEFQNSLDEIKIQMESEWEATAGKSGAVILKAMNEN